MRLRQDLGRQLRDTRVALDVSQSEVAAVAGISRSHLAKVERSQANVTIDLAERLGRALGLEFDIVARPPVIVDGPTQKDLVHARCSAYVDRRLRRAGWTTAREVELVEGRYRGWIDILAYQPMIRSVIVVEVKTRLDDIGAIERQLAWYESGGRAIALRRGWRPATLRAWLLALASEEVERSVLLNRDLLDRSFPLRAPALLSLLEGVEPFEEGRGLGLIDPSSKRRAWILRCRVDGRRSPARWVNYADAARRFAG